MDPGAEQGYVRPGAAVCRQKPYIALKPLPQESVVDTLRTAMEIMEAESRAAKAAKTE